MAKVTLENFSETIQKIIDEYGEEVDKNLDEVVNKTGQKAVQLLRSTSPVDEHSPQSGAYKKGWRLQKSEKAKSRLFHTAIAYNVHPGLPHLLEFGHALRQGGRAPAVPHIKKVEDAVYNSLGNLEGLV